MKESMKKSIMSGFAGHALTAVVSVVVAIITTVILLPRNSAGSGDSSTVSGGFIEILKEFKTLIYFLAPMIIINVIPLVESKIRATRQRREKELENRGLELQNQQLELQNQQLELQKKNQQSLPKE